MNSVRAAQVREIPPDTTIAAAGVLYFFYEVAV